MKSEVFHHITKLISTVRVSSPDLRFGNMLFEKLGGPNSELAAATQYDVQGLNIEYPVGGGTRCVR